MLELDNARAMRKLKREDQGTARRMRVVSVTSGKGGVGKSSVVTNLAMAMGARGRRVLLMDGDFGLANLDIMLDLKPRGTLRDVLFGERDPADILAKVSPNVDILPASSGLLEMTSIGLAEKGKLLDVMQSLERDYDLLLIDTGAGIGDEVTWLNSAAGEIVVVVTPEPTSIADAYALIKVLNQRNKIKNFRLLVNQVRSDAEGLKVYQQMTAVSDRFLNVSIDYLGCVLWDDLWTHAIRQRKPIFSAFPGSDTAKNFERLADTLSRASDRMVASGNPHFFKALLGHA